MEPIKDRKFQIENLVFNPEYMWSESGLFDRFVLVLLKILMVFSLAVGILGVVFGWKVASVSAGAALAALFAAYGLFKKGRRNSASVLILIILVTVIFVNIFLGGGIYDDSLLLLPGVILLASLILRRRIYLTFLLIVLALFIVSTYGALMLYGKIPEKSSGPGDIWVAFIFLVLTIVIINFFTNMLFRLTAAAKENEEKFRVLTEGIKLGIYSFS